MNRMLLNLKINCEIRTKEKKNMAVNLQHDVQIFDEAAKIFQKSSNSWST